MARANVLISRGVTCGIHDFSRALVTLTLNVVYVDGYPDVLPELSLTAVKGELDDGEAASLLGDIRRVVSFFLTIDLKVRVVVRRHIG